MQLRWLAVTGQIATICLVHYGMGIELPIASMAAVVAFLAVLNAISLLRHRTQGDVTSMELFLELLLDVAALTIQLYLSGGAGNPFVSLYLLQVILGAVLLEAWATWTLVAIASACFLLLTVFHRELALPHRHDGQAFGLHVQGMFVSFALAAVLIVFFVARISANLRARDARLAELRRRSAEEELIVRMGLLASGAAHELGTPLSTIAVILNDWQRMPRLHGDAEIAGDIEEMQAQLGRCKEIVSKVLVSSGEARGEGAAATTVARFFDALVNEWRRTQSPIELDYHNRFEPDQAIVSDVALKQGLVNVLDNAIEVSPDWVGVDVWRESETLIVAVSDGGPGFADAALESFGRPYQSTKGEPGGGLGLFLLVNVVRKLGGSVVPGRAAAGGARIEVRLPLQSLSVESGHDA